MKYLLVDDNPGFRKVAREIIAHANDEFYELDDGINILTAYEDCQPDWVLMDIQMKQVNGFDATRTLLKSFPQARVIIVTNYESPAYAQKARELGAWGFVSKEHLELIDELTNTSKTIEKQVMGGLKK